MIILDEEVENLSLLVERLSTIGDVAQVRCNPILRQLHKDKVGGEGLCVMCLVQKRDKSDFYFKFIEYFTYDDIRNIENHDAIVQKFKITIDDYIFKGIMPKGQKDVD